MPTIPNKDDSNSNTPKPPEAKTPAKADDNTAAQTQAANSATMVGFRDNHVTAADAYAESVKASEEAQREGLRNATPADEVGNAAYHNPGNQVPQEGALVETPPQPVPPSYTKAELEEMDHAPAGLREPSVAAKSDDTDQTVHPRSRVNDPSKPL